MTVIHLQFTFQYEKINTLMRLWYYVSNKDLHSNMKRLILFQILMIDFLYMNLHSNMKRLIHDCKRCNQHIVVIYIPI